MKIYYAGSDNSRAVDRLLRQMGVRFRLNSYHYLKEHKLPPPVGWFDFLLDSGGFTARKSGIFIDVHEYAAFINRFGCRNVFNLDTNNVDETLKNQKILNASTNAYVLPIYHLSDFLSDSKSLIDNYVAKYPYIALGGVAGLKPSDELLTIFYDYVFSRTKGEIKVHGLGITDQKYLRRYPWYSVDSTTWMSFGRYGNTRFIKDKRAVKFRASKKHYMENYKIEVAGWLKIEKQITDLWEERGVVWHD